MNKSLLNRHTTPCLMILALSSGILFSPGAQSVALYNSTVDATLGITTSNSNLLFGSATGTADFFQTDPLPNLLSDAFGDAVFFDTGDGFAASVIADGTAALAPGDTTATVESFGQVSASLNVFNVGPDPILVDFTVDYFWDWGLSVDSLLNESASLDLFLEIGIDGLFTTLLDVSSIANPAASDFGLGSDLFSFQLGSGFSTLTMNLFAKGLATVAVPEPSSLTLMMLGLAVFGFRRGLSIPTNSH